MTFNSFLACGDFCHMLITFANSLDPDQDRRNVGPDLDPNCLTLWWCSWKNFMKKVILKICSRRHKIMKNFPACKELTTWKHPVSHQLQRKMTPTDHACSIFLVTLTSIMENRVHCGKSRQTLPHELKDHVTNKETFAKWAYWSTQRNRWILPFHRYRSATF